MKRLERDQAFIAMAHAASGRGTCNRLKVGAILALDSRPVSMGYNGSPPKLPHCDGSCNERNPCKNTIHAEHNAIKWALEHNPHASHLEGCTIYLTDSPCLVCCYMILGAGIKRVVYDRPYRITTGIDYLKSKGVEVVQCRVSVAINVSSASTQTTPVLRV